MFLPGFFVHTAEEGFLRKEVLGVWVGTEDWVERCQTRTHILKGNKACKVSEY